MKHPIIRRKEARGFSLIEVLVVMAILATIMALVAKNVFKGKEKANWQAAKIQVGKLEQAAQEFYLDTGHLPNSPEDLVRDTGDSMWSGPYVKEKMLKDPWGQPITMREGDSEIIFCSYGKDKSPGGSKYDADVCSNE